MRLRAGEGYVAVGITELWTESLELFSCVLPTYFLPGLRGLQAADGARFNVRKADGAEPRAPHLEKHIAKLCATDDVLYSRAKRNLITLVDYIRFKNRSFCRRMT
jgi:hypothetical protein